MDRPDWSSLHGMVDDLKRAIGSLGETQRQIMQVTGTGWSPDRLVKAVVGPRGQLIDLKIDPRVFRTPDSRGLEDAILAAATAAITDANAKSVTIVDQAVPADLRRGPFGDKDQLGEVIRRHDAEFAGERGGNDE